MASPPEQVRASRKNLTRWRWLVFPLIYLLGVGSGWLVRPKPLQGHPLAPLPIDLHLDGSTHWVYVALGDSYSAGEGLPPWRRGTEDVADDGDRCHRSKNYAYPMLLTFVQDTQRFFRACSGAVVDNVFKTIQTHSDKGQSVADFQGFQGKPRVLGDEVSLVTLTMGGNDLDFAKVLEHCFFQKECADSPYDKSPTLRTWVDSSLAALRPKLVKLYSRIHNKAPNARILVLGYPALFPESAPPPVDVRSVVCDVAFHRFTASEREAIRDAGLKLNRTIREASKEAGVEYVDVFPYFVGHEPCGSSGQWVRFVDDVRKGVIRDGSFHPLPDGHAMMARIISCYLHFNPTADTLGTEEKDYAMAGCVAKELVKETPAPEPTATVTDAPPPSDAGS